MKSYYRRLLMPVLAGCVLPTYADDAVGAAKDTKMPNANAAINEESPLSTMAPVTVYGRQRDDTVKAIPQTVNVYDQENFEISAAETVGDVIRLTPSASPSGSGHDMLACPHGVIRLEC